MTALPNQLYRCAQVKALDKAAVEIQKIDSFDLMQKAGQAAFSLLQYQWPGVEEVTVFCGAGNNAGDGYVVAALAAEAGLSVQVLTLVDPQTLTAEAHLAFQLADSSAASISRYNCAESVIRGVVVDALLGIGISGAVRLNYAEAILAINTSNLPILAIDIPSGICGDTGCVLGSAVKATFTICFIGLKQGLFTADATDHCGNIIYQGLGIPSEVFESQQASCQRLSYVPPLLPRRLVNSHKGLFGRVVVIGGDRNFGGAGIMAAESALISGAGLVTLATQPEHVAAALARRPELMVSGIDSADQLELILNNSDVLNKAKILIVGPGVGQSVWSNEVVECSLQSGLTAIIDADGLNLLATKFKHYSPRDNWLLTPHPAEAARLLGISTAQVQADRFAAATELQQQYGGVIVLKGAGTIVADTNRLYLCSAGNPSMSTPGMGDVLSGILGGLLAQGLSLSDSARLGVWAHATAADRVAERSTKTMLATEIYADLRALW
ncbi:MAG: NAD(P)H-hydrate epimerase [Arenicella sp.]|jgi:NAD(P)H-hydrate epimerase